MVQKGVIHPTSIIDVSDWVHRLDDLLLGGGHGMIIIRQIKRVVSTFNPIAREEEKLRWQFPPVPIVRAAPSAAAAAAGDDKSDDKSDAKSDAKSAPKKRRSKGSADRALVRTIGTGKKTAVSLASAASAVADKKKREDDARAADQNARECGARPLIGGRHYYLNLYNDSPDLSMKEPQPLQVRVVSL